MAVSSLSAAADVSTVLMPQGILAGGAAVAATAYGAHHLIQGGLAHVNRKHGRLEASKGLPLDHYKGVTQVGRVSFCFNQKQQVKRLDKSSLFLSYKPPPTHITRARSASLICSASLNARCGGAEGQTQTIEKPSSVIQNAPSKDKSPQLDDGGTGLPPLFGSGGGGGGGGGGGNFSGGFFFFGFLVFLGFLKDKESEGGDSRR